MQLCSAGEHGADEVYPNAEEPRGDEQRARFLRGGGASRYATASRACLQQGPHALAPGRDATEDVTTPAQGARVDQEEPSAGGLVRARDPQRGQAARGTVNNGDIHAASIGPVHSDPQRRPRRMPHSVRDEFSDDEFGRVDIAAVHAPR